MRDALRRLSSWDNFDLDALTGELKISLAASNTLLRELAGKSYIEPAERSSGTETGYRLTQAGRQFILASGAKPISRTAAATKLAEFLQRVAAVNSNPDYISVISNVYVFGSFLTDATQLSDLDIAYATKRRYVGDAYSQHAAQRIAIADAAGRSFGNIIERAAWPETEILRFLKAKSRGLSLHHAAELTRLGCAFKEVFPNNDMAGDPDLAAAIRQLRSRG